MVTRFEGALFVEVPERLEKLEQLFLRFLELDVKAVKACVFNDPRISTTRSQFHDDNTKNCGSKPELPFQPVDSGLLARLCVKSAQGFG